MPLMQFTRLTRSPATNVANPGLSKDHMPIQRPSMPSKNADPIRVKTHKPEGTITPRRFVGGNGGNPRLASTQSRHPFQSTGQSHSGFGH